MRDWVEYLKRESMKLDGENLIKTGLQFGDWLALDEWYQNRALREGLMITLLLLYITMHLLKKSMKRQRNLGN